MKHPNFKNPIIAAQTFDFPFVADSYQGHTMPLGREFLGEDSFISLEEMIKTLKSSKKKVILNIGDSSTSGWDSNIVTQNRDRFSKKLPLLPAFFQYKTYSDCLRISVGNEYIVINAGVPAHTSLQGNRRIKLLFKRFRQEHIRIDWVTIYYGNNDSVWDHNRQDKEWVGCSKLIAFLKSLKKFFKKGGSGVITRVVPNDYYLNMKEIIQTCKENHSNVIVIEPTTPIYWKPGTRVLNEDLERKPYPGSTAVYQMLDEARSLWEQAIGQTEYSSLKELALIEVREKDYVVPRIKKHYVALLRKLAKEMDIWYVQVNIERKQDDICYFIDYCHPIEKANELISKKIIEIISGKKSKEECFPMDNQPSLSTAKEIESFNHIPTDHYTLY